MWSEAKLGSWRRDTLYTRAVKRIGFGSFQSTITKLGNEASVSKTIIKQSQN